MALVLAAFVVCADETSLTDGEMWNQGVEYYRTGDVTNALRVLRPLMLSKTHGPRAAEVVAKLEYDRGNLEEAAGAAQIALRAAPDDAKANRNFTRATDGLLEARETKRINDILKAAKGKAPGGMMLAATKDARQLMTEAGAYRTNAPARAVAMADALSKRAERLADTWIPVREVIAQSVTNEEQAATIIQQLEQAQSMADISQKSLEDCRLYAPVSGVIGNISVEKGMNVLPYQPVFNIMNISQLAIKINIPENEISKIRIGQKVKVRVSSLDDAVFEGAVDERGVAADELSHSYPVKIRLSRTPKDLLPGMVCKVAFAGGNSSEGFEIPNRAVQLDNDGRRFVWVAEDGTAHRRYVTIGDLTRNGVIISSGIEENEQVITDGISKICEGSKIKIK